MTVPAGSRTPSRTRRFTLPAALILALSGTLGFAQSTPAVTVPPQVTATQQDGPWWKHAFLYEIYPRSFQDSNGDGIGDLNGISQRMDYLQSLGVDAIWLAPMYPSPQVDFGYDISDYESIDPQYGTLADFDKLVDTGKQHHVRIILDMVMNHTSDKHKWFLESASSRTNPKADWYVWNDGISPNSPNVSDFQKKYQQTGPKGPVVPPNNWVSVFGGSAWEWVPARQQYYYHEFYKQQPDLNWRNPAVEKAMFDTIRFWLDRGVAGFRFDAVPDLFEDKQLRNAKLLGGTDVYGDPRVDSLYTENLPEVHDVMRRMHAMVAKYPGDRVLIGETYLPNSTELDKWYGGAKHDELQLPMDMLVGFTNKLDVNLFRTRIGDAETGLHGNQPLFVFDNHDNPRSWDRYSEGVTNPEDKQRIARIIASMLLTTRATALSYYGAEIGMVTSTPTRVQDVKDPIGVTGWPKEKGRDGERTPMQWTPGKDAGFSTADQTWLPIASDYKTVNVEVENPEPDSLLSWHRKLIALRRTDPTMRNGEMVMLNKDSNSVFAYARKGVSGHPSELVALNFTGEPQTITLDTAAAGLTGSTVSTILTDADSLKGAGTLTLTLPPYASWIGSLQGGTTK